MPSPDDPSPAAPPAGGPWRILRRLLLLAAALALCAAATVGGLWLLVPRLVNVDAVRARLVEELSATLSVHIQTRAAELTLWPLPRLTLRGVRAEVPGTSGFEASVVEITADPWSLVRRTVRIRSIRVEAPRVRLPIPDVPSGDALSLQGVARAEDAIARLLSAAAARLSGASLSVARGRVELADRRGTRFWFDRVDASLSLSRHSLSGLAACTASVAERLAVDLSLDPGRHAGRVHLSASRLRSDDLARYLRAERPGWITGALWSGDATAVEASQGVWTADGAASTPAYRVVRGPRRLELGGVRVQGTVAVSGPRWEVSLTSGTLERPRVALSGSFSWNPAAPQAALALEASDLEIAPLRAAALTLVPDVPLVRRLCDLLQGGQVPRLSITSRAPEPAQLGELAALSLRASLAGGSLHVPGADLPVTDAAGEVALSGGVLTGSGLSGRSGASSARAARLRMGFLGPQRPFSFEGELSADLAQLRQLLPGWLRPGVLRDELRLVDTAQGRATGRLVLGERLDHLTAAVEVRAFDVSGRYRRIPFPLELRGSFNARKGRAAVAGLTGRVGGSTVEGAAAEVTFGRVPHLRVTSGQGSLDVAELYPWLLTAPGARQALRDVGPPSGRLAVSSLSVDGPARHPSQWTIRTRGAIGPFAVPSLWFPGRLSLAAGGWAWSDGAFSWSGVRASLLDAEALTSGRATGLRAGPRSVDASVEGDFGPRAAGWIARESSLPGIVKVSRAVALRRGRLTWAESGASFQGELAPAKGLTLDVEVRTAAGRVEVPRLVVRDALSDARLSLAVLPGTWDVGFTGHLHADTLEALLDRGRFWFTELDGEFSAHVRPDAPRASSATGRLRLTGVRVPVGRAATLTLDRAALAGSGRTVTIEGAEGSLGAARFSLSGRLEAQSEAYRADLRITAGEVDAEALDEALGLSQTGSAWGRLGKRLRELPVHGRAAFDVATLRYGRYAWSPLRGTVSLAGGLLTADLQEATVCGVATPGQFDVGPSGIRADLRAVAEGPDLDAPLACLWDRGGLATGRYRLTASAQAAGRRGELLRSSAGDVALSARDGRIYRFGLLAKVFAVLNVTEVFRGRLPDLFHEGFAYRTLEADASLERGTLVFRHATLDGASERIFWDGRVDLVKREVDLTVLVAPFKTIDAILAKIPVVGYLLGGRLVAIPLRVQGSLDDPSVVPLHPADIGAGLLGVVERTLKLPFHLIQPLLPSGNGASPVP
ncbi:MAG: AsmA-like C-terminal domain-containing protein [Deltaproteobacteria bacterium]|nr:AsmA-like C-terminal domain-containing protein [Deltaproteobacteria bacterium]